jgi:hypothetical protein
MGLNMTDPLLQKLEKFANERSRSFTKLPIVIELLDLPIRNILGKKPYRVVARAINYKRYPKDKRYNPWLIKWGIELDKSHYNENKHNISELHQTILHELAHIALLEKYNEGSQAFRHGTEFKKTAKEMGVDNLHLKQYWDD